ncbi:MAG: bifunctional phosphopantothenoylcysteine decarboxylase/phosphopantothenate--cysteine ligase CoaBC [Raoultibacter sp.]
MEESQQQRTVLLGVTGCIAAYKSAEIIRGLQKAGVRVKVVMTQNATHFVDPTTFRALTREPVSIGLFDDPNDPIHHISLAQEADLFLLAPCTANVMAKIACGIADDLLTTTALATKAPIVIAPAMNVNMYENTATRANMGTLFNRGAHFIEAGEGYLACGDTGRGRMADVSRIINEVLLQLKVGLDLADKQVMITAGPTIEPIDPVRYITNHSSGKTGYALAGAAARRGAQVTLISGPVMLAAPEGVHLVQVQTAREMFEACQEAFASTDIAIFSAAVSDMRPEVACDHKLKKRDGVGALSKLQLVENPDILAAMGKAKHHQVVVGFAAETDDVIENAREKLLKKNADMIVANEVGENKGFGTDDNKVCFVTPETVVDLPVMPKNELADVILDKSLSFLA